ncbi:MAG: hypothetical protein HYV09_08300 [Deltaproteobacteria bacterium]|nr:hypothetical protein [Deltaproteobacteria bacterium]
MLGGSLPVFAVLLGIAPHDLPAPHDPAAQHTPSVQNPLVHVLALVQAVPRPSTGMHTPDLQ